MDGRHVDDERFRAGESGDAARTGDGGLDDARRIEAQDDEGRFAGSVGGRDGGARRVGERPQLAASGSKTVRTLGPSSRIAIAEPVAPTPMTATDGAD